jgi:hypothetical protein
MPIKRAESRAHLTSAIVDFHFEDRSYQIDPRLKKVYRRFVEIETSKAAEIFAVWRSLHATA